MEPVFMRKEKTGQRKKKMNIPANLPEKQTIFL
jgi:hypothetical protein